MLSGLVKCSEDEDLVPPNVPKMSCLLPGLREHGRHVADRIPAQNDEPASSTAGWFQLLLKDEQ